MAITFDAVSTTNTGASGTALTWAHTCSGTNLCLIVAIGSNGATATGVTYAGVAMTQLGVDFESTTGYRVSLWRLVGPAVGANNIVAAFAATQAVECKALSFTGVDQSTPNGTFASNKSAGSALATVNVTSSATELVVDALVWNHFSGPATESAGAQQTERGSAAGTFTRCAMSTEAGSATVTMSWGLSGATNWAQGAVPLKAAAVAAGGIAFASASTTQNSTPTTSIVIGPPTSIANGDLLFAALTWTSGTVTVSGAPAGWTLIGNTTTGVSNQIYVATYYKVASGEAGSYTWTLTGTGINNCGSIWRITGAHATTPFDAFSGTTGTGANASAPTLTTATNNELVAFVVGYSSTQAGIAFSTPSGYTPRDILTSTGVSDEYTASTVQAGAGATGAVATNVSGVIAGDTWAAQLVAFKPPVVSVDPRQSGDFSVPQEMALYRQRRYPMGYTAFMNQDIAAAALLPAGPFNWTTLPPEFDSGSVAELWPQDMVQSSPPDAQREMALYYMPSDMTVYRRRRYPMGYTAFMSRDATPTALLPTGVFGWDALPPVFDGASSQAHFGYGIEETPPVPDLPGAPGGGGGIASSTLYPRISLPPQTLDDTEQWQRQSAAWMNEANQGHLQNTGIITLNANQNTTVVIDERAGLDTYVGFMPRTVNAAAEMGNGSMWVSTQAKQSFTITHANNAQTDRTFIYTLLG